MSSLALDYHSGHVTNTMMPPTTHRHAAQPKNIDVRSPFCWSSVGPLMNAVIPHPGSLEAQRRELSTTARTVGRCAVRAESSRYCAACQRNSS